MNDIDDFQLYRIVAKPLRVVWLLSPLLIFPKKNKRSKLLEYNPLGFVPSTVAFCYYSYSDFIVVTALTGKTSSLHTLYSYRLTGLRGRPIFATAFVYNLAKVVSQGEFNMPRNHILWSILKKVVRPKPDWLDWLLRPCYSVW